MTHDRAGATQCQPIIDQCPLCGSTTAPVFAAFPEMTWVKCGCGLIYLQSAAAGTRPRGSENIYEVRYSKRTQRRVNKSRHQILDVLNHAAPGDLLDIGCSLGYTLRAGSELGMKSSGLEVDPIAAKACQQQGYDVQSGTMGALPFADGQFQVVTMKHVLEHTPDPRQALAEVRRVLKERGGLFIAVPNAGYHKAVRNPQTSRFYIPSPYGPEGGHYIYYTPATLSRLLDSAGFDVVQVHPHLLHRSAPLATQALQLLFAPLRWAGQQLAQAFGLQKEFWLVAIRRAD